MQKKHNLSSPHRKATILKMGKLAKMTSPKDSDRILLVSSSKIGARFPQRSDHLLRALRELGYDVVAVEGFNPLFGILGVLKYRARYKIFSGFRAGFAGLFLSLFGIRWVYDLVECKWKLCSDNWEGLKRILVPLIHAVEVLMIKRAGSVLAAIPSAYKYAKRIREDRIYFAPNGRDELLFDPSKYDRTSLRREYGVSFPLAIYVGKLTPMYAKFLRPAIDAMSIVNKEMPDAELWIYGDGPSRGELERRASEGGGNVRFKGYIDHNKVPEVVAIADVGVHAYDGESLKMVEWLSMGLPTIVPSSLRFDGAIPCRWDAKHIAERLIELLRRPERKVYEMPSWRETATIITKLLN